MPTSGANRPYFSWLSVREARLERTVATIHVDEESLPSSWNVVVDEIVSELGRLPVDWAGPGTVPPSATTVSAIERFAGYLPSSTIRPLVEVDEDNGHVTLSWISDDKQRMFSLLFPDRDEVVGSYSSLEPGASQRPWKYRTNEETKIVTAIDQEWIRHLLTAR